MLLFKLLVLAHLIADFPLQCTAVYRLKLRAAAGQALHALICLAAAAVLGYPMLSIPSYRVFIVMLAASHWAIDTFKVRVLDRRAGTDNLWTFLLDQALHLAAAAAVFLTPLSGMAAVRESALGALDRAGAVTAMIFICAAVFGGAYLLSAVKRTILHFPPAPFPRPRFEKYHGILERAAFFAVVAAGGIWLACIPLIFAARLPLANRCAKRFRPRPFLLSRADAAGNLIVASAFAFAARACMR